MTRRYFRDLLVAAPLKQFSVCPIERPRIDFRDLLVAAPLKLPPKPEVSALPEDFRDLLVAAPLKPRELTSIGVRAEQAASFAREVIKAPSVGDLRFCVLVPAEHGFEFAVVESTSGLSRMLEPFGRPGPRAAIVLNAAQLIADVVKRAAAVLTDVRGTTQ